MNIEDIEIDNIPSGWEWSTLGEVCEKSQYGWTTKANHELGALKLLRTTDITSGQVDWSTVPFCSEVPDDIKKYLLKSGDILISRAGSVGVSFLINKPEHAVFASYLIRFRARDIVDTKYLYYFLKSPDYWATISESKAGIAVQNVNASKLSEVRIPIAPRAQQTRIVAEIEKQFSRLDEAVANLKRVKVNLKRYKAAVLKAAVEGKLTEEWRRGTACRAQDSDHTTKAGTACRAPTETGAELLERILAERRKAVGKGKYKEPVAPDTSGLPELPSGWVWTNFEQLAEAIPSAIKAGPFGSALKKSYYVQEGYKIYGQEQVIREDPYYGDYYIDDERYKDLSSCAVKPGDLLISLVGTIGRVLILPDDIEPGIINPRLVKISLDRQLVNPLFIKIYLQSTYVKTLFTIASHGGTMDILNLGILKEIPIPLPPIKEQAMILEEFERISSIEAELASTIESNRVRADRLRQSILKQAFSGQLVTQDPNDEPASVLLERIQAHVSIGADRVRPERVTRKAGASVAPLRKPRSQPEPAPAVSDKFACLDDITAVLLAAMLPGREYARADLADPLGLTTGQWNAAIQELKRVGKVRQVGEKRGARYLLLS